MDKKEQGLLESEIKHLAYDIRELAKKTCYLHSHIMDLDNRVKSTNVQVDVLELCDLVNHQSRQLSEQRDLLSEISKYCRQHFSQQRKPVLTKAEEFIEIYDFHPRLMGKIEDDMCCLSARASNTFKNVNIKYIGELVRYSTNSLMLMPNFGAATLQHIKLELRDIDLEFGSKIADNFPKDHEKIEAIRAITDPSLYNNYDYKVKSKAYKEDE